MEPQPKYRRILVKLSGEALMGDKEFGIDPDTLVKFAKEIQSIHSLGVQIGIVIGGGNIFRGVKAVAQGFHPVSGDYMGMLATVINCLAFQNVLENIGIQTRLQTALKMEQVAEPFIRRRAIRHLEKNRVVLFGGGTGHPFFTTDTAAVLFAAEIEAEIVVKATKVDGVFNCDPKVFSDAIMFDRITFNEVLEKNLRVMDHTAITLCKEKKIPVVVFNVHETGNLKRFVLGEKIGTIVYD